MNILVTVTNMTVANGGVNTHIIDLCEGLLKLGEQVVFVTDENQCDYDMDINHLKEMENFTYFSISMLGVQSNPGKMLYVAKRLCNIIKKYHIDLVHTHSQSLCVVAQLIKIRLKVPYIWTNHIDAIANPRLFKKILYIFHFSIISVSTDLKKMLMENYKVSEGRITVVNNGINLKKFKPLSLNEKDTLMNKWECKGNFVVGILARMVPIKGHRYLLKAIDLIQKKYHISNIKLLVAGKAYDEGYLKELLRYSKENDINMSYVGFQNPRNFFGVCNVSVLPSVLEGFGLTVLESLAMGCPVIRSDTPGYSDTKEITYIFEKEDVEGLAQYLLYAYEKQDEIRKMAELGRKIVWEKFTIESQVRETIKVYKDIIS